MPRGVGGDGKGAEGENHKQVPHSGQSWKQDSTESDAQPSQPLGWVCVTLQGVLR